MLAPRQEQVVCWNGAWLLAHDTWEAVPCSPSGERCQLLWHSPEQGYLATLGGTSSWLASFLWHHLYTHEGKVTLLTMKPGEDTVLYRGSLQEARCHFLGPVEFVMSAPLMKDVCLHAQRSLLPHDGALVYVELSSVHRGLELEVSSGWSGTWVSGRIQSWRKIIETLGLPQTHLRSGGDQQAEVCLFSGWCAAVPALLAILCRQTKTGRGGKPLDGRKVEQLLEHLYKLMGEVSLVVHIVLGEVLLEEPCLFPPEVGDGFSLTITRGYLKADDVTRSPWLRHLRFSVENGLISACSFHLTVSEQKGPALA